MNNLIISKLFSGLENLIIKNDFRVYGMPSFTYFLKKIENNPNVHIIFLVKKKLFLANKLILKKKVKNFDKEIIFINEYYFLKNRKFKKIFQILNEIFKFFYITFFIKNKNVKNLKVDTSSLIPCYFISKIINVSINLRLYGSYTLNFQKKKKKSLFLFI